MNSAVLECVLLVVANNLERLLNPKMRKINPDAINILGNIN